MNKGLSILDEFKFPVIGRTNPFLDLLDNTFDTKYPPYNILKLADGYMIEIAVPGWNRENLDVSYDKGMLTVKGSKRQYEDEVEGDFVFKGLSTKAFSRNWLLSKDLDVEEVFLENGLLCVKLCEIVPEKPEKLIIK